LPPGLFPITYYIQGLYDVNRKEFIARELGGQQRGRNRKVKGKR
jgi:hypothetical protein